MRRPLRNPLPIFLAVALCALLVEAFKGRVLWNVTTSIPRGAYWIARAERVERGQLVTLPIPDSVQLLVYERGYAPRSFRLLAKPVAAVGGDHVCIRGELFINGQPFAAVRHTDLDGRPMPRHDICRTLQQGELFLATGHANSFDSRNFGPVALDSLRGTLRPLLTF